jgi:crotonobetaine/carnitine-CoA ligase
MLDPMTSTPVEERTTAAMLAHNAKKMPNKVAVIDGSGESVTYAELQARAFSIAAGLGELGVRRQEPVAVMLDSNMTRVLTWLGITVGGMIEVPINTAYKGDMLSYVLSHSGARVAIVDGNWCDRFAEIADGLGELETIVVVGQSGPVPARFRKVELDVLLRADSVEPDQPVAVSDIAAILYTSGTEGASKGVLCPHGAAFSMASYPPLTGDDEVVLVTLPLFHAAGLWASLYNALRVGGTAVVQQSFSASQFWAQVRRHRVTTTVLMGAMADFLWRQSPSQEDRNHPMRYIGFVPAPRYINEFAERFGVEVGSAYGQTEVGITHVTQTGEAGPAICGRPRDFYDVRVVDDYDNEMARGEAGEIVVRSREPWTMMLGYHKMPQATLRAQRNLWHHTGDVGFVNDDGLFVFADRKKDSLRRRGENISSFEVEKHILARSDVAECAVVAAPSEYAEDEIKAVLVMGEGCEFDPLDMLRDLCERMPYFMVPRFYEVREWLPKTPTHKVRKLELRASGITEAVWDCEKAGYLITRTGLVERSSD